MIIVHARDTKGNSHTLCGRMLDSGDKYLNNAKMAALVQESKCDCGVAFHILERWNLAHDCADCDNLLADNTTSSENTQPVNLNDELENAKSWATNAKQEMSAADAKVSRLKDLEYYLRNAAQYLEPGETYSLPDYDIYVTRM